MEYKNLDSRYFYVLLVGIALFFVLFKIINPDYLPLLILSLVIFLFVIIILGKENTHNDLKIDRQQIVYNNKGKAITITKSDIVTMTVEPRARFYGSIFFSSTDGILNIKTKETVHTLYLSPKQLTDFSNDIEKFSYPKIINFKEVNKRITKMNSTDSFIRKATILGLFVILVVGVVAIIFTFSYIF